MLARMSEPDSVDVDLVLDFCNTSKQKEPDVNFCRLFQIAALCCPFGFDLHHRVCKIKVCHAASGIKEGRTAPFFARQTAMRSDARLIDPGNVGLSDFDSFIAKMKANLVFAAAGSAPRGVQQRKLRLVWVVSDAV